MMRFVLVRPGATDYDLQGRMKGTLDIPLCEKGQEQAKQLAEALAPHKPGVIYSSTCRAARETADILTSVLRVPINHLEGLQNLDHGLWAGALVKDVKQRQPRVYKQWQEHPETVCPPEGETLGEAQDRVRSELEEIIRQNQTSTAVLVVPEPLASIVRSELGLAELGDLWRAECMCGTWEVLEPKGLPVRT